MAWTTALTTTTRQEIGNNHWWLISSITVGIGCGLLVFFCLYYSCMKTLRAHGCIRSPFETKIVSLKKNDSLNVPKQVDKESEIEEICCSKEHENRANIAIMDLKDSKDIKPVGQSYSTQTFKTAEEFKRLSWVL